MSSKVQFSLRRLGLLMWNDLWSWRYSAILVTSVVVGVLSITTVVSVGVLHQNGAPAQWLHVPVSSFLLMGSGLVWVSMTFTRFGSTPELIAHGMLPASREEKFLTRWLLSTIGTVIGLLLLYKIQALLSAAVIALLFSDSIASFNPFTKEVGHVVHTFLVAHSIMFLGAVYFRRMAFLKTIFAVVVLSMALAVFVLLLTRIFFWNDLAYGGFFTSAMVSRGDQPVVGTMPKAVEIFYSYLLAPACWVIAYVRYREIEV